jgi:hypothetical protein
LLLPLKDAGAGGGGFGLGDVSGALEGNGEAGVGERVLGRECREAEGGGDGRFQALLVGESANEAMMGFDVVVLGRYGGAEGVFGSIGIVGREQIEAVLRLLIGDFGRG